jgi:putative ABC transport system permease protein
VNGLALLCRLSLRRFRRRPLGVILSICGVAAGVGLMFAVQLVNDRLIGSYEQKERGMVGSADIQLSARSPTGFDQRLYTAAERIPGVKAVAPVTEHDVVLATSSRNVDATLFGVDARLRGLGGSLGRDSVRPDADESALGLYVSASMAKRLDVAAGGEIAVRYRGQERRVLVARVMSNEDLGPLAKMPLATAPLGVAQSLTRSDGRLSQLVVDAQPGSTPRVLRDLQRLAGGQADAFRIGREAKILAQAAGPDRAGASLFSAVSLFVGALLAFNAILLPVLARRREIAIMRMVGATTATLVGALLVEALLIGAAGTALGLLIGFLLAAGFSGQTPVYLEAAFALSPQQVTPLSTVAAAVIAGVFVSLAAALYPARIIAKVPPAAALRAEDHADAGRGVRGAPRRWSALLGIALLAFGAALAIAVPEVGIAGILTFVVGAAVLLPHLVPRLVRALRRALATRGPGVHVATAELANVPWRTTATASIGAATAMLLVVVGGVVTNIEDGTKSLNRDFWGYGDLWLTVRSNENVFITKPFDERVLRRIEQSPAVRRAAPYRAAFLDWNGRRVLVFGVTPGFGLKSSNEIMAGDPATLTRRIATGPDVAVSGSLVRQMGLERGQRFELPTPSGRQDLRVAGTISSYGWPPGAIAMDARRFARLWGSTDVTAVQIDVAPGLPPSQAKRELEALLRPVSGLRLETAHEGWSRANEVTETALAPLRRIATAVGLAAAFAAAAAMLTAVAQRRRRLAALRAIGMSTRQLYGAILAEAGAVLAIGVAVGLAVGLAAQALSVTWLTRTAGFHVSFSPAPDALLSALGFAGVIALIAGAVPARRVARTPIADSLAYE